MRRAVLLFNPAAGRPGRLRTIDAVAAALREKGLRVEAIPTQGPGTAGAQAAAIAASGVDILFACGGDGTVHETLQGLVESPSAGRTALGVLPLGTANALARDLGLPLDPVAAALLQLEYTPRTIPLGRLEFVGTSGPATRYFIVMAGAGPHAMLVYSMLTGGGPLKRRTGRVSYYLRATSLFLSELRSFYQASRFPQFRVEVCDAVTGERRLFEAISAIAVRVASLGGLFHPLATGGSLDGESLRLILVRPPALLGLPLWVGLSWLGLAKHNPFTEVLDVSSFTCEPVAGAPGIQADGAWLGRSSTKFSIVPAAVRLLMPSK